MYVIIEHGADDGRRTRIEGVVRKDNDSEERMLHLIAKMRNLLVPDPANEEDPNEETQNIAVDDSDSGNESDLDVVETPEEGEGVDPGNPGDFSGDSESPGASED